MKKIFVFSIFICLNNLLFANENPLMELTGKPYCDIHIDIAIYNTQINYAQTTEEADSLYAFIADVVRQTGDPCWELEAEYSLITYKNREQLRLGPNNDYYLEDYLQDMTALIERGRKDNCHFLPARCLFILMEGYRNIWKDYEKAFDIARQLTEELQPIPAADFPNKMEIYIQLSDLYYTFQDYEEARIYAEKILKDKEVAFVTYDLHRAYNMLSLIARDYDHDIEQSNEWNRKILALPCVDDDQQAWKGEAWQGIAASNLGQNLFLMEKYEESIAYFRKGIEIMSKQKDFYFVTGSAATLAEIYLLKNDLSHAKEMLDYTAQCIDSCPYNKRYHLYFPILSRYYEKMGDMSKALLYKDSALWAQDLYNQEYNALKLVRSEQRAHRMEQKMKEEELKMVKLRNKNYRTMFAIVSVGLLVVLALLIYSNQIYRKKRSAYKELIRKAEAWAQTPIPVSPASAHAQPIIADDQMAELIAKITDLMENAKIYLDATLTLDMMADRLEVNRVYLSQALNYGIGKKFSDYINEYRVQESIRILSKGTSRQYSIEIIASLSGFNDRKTFYRVFKKITGLSPTEYWKGLKS